MNSTAVGQDEVNVAVNVAQASAVSLKPSEKIRPPEKKPLTFGQQLADKLASKVGSWAFLIGQSTVLVGWVEANMVPGIPHWDEAPFILLNLMFSFASAYTAPVVLMSQNRQSEEDRETANHNYQITLQAAQNLELLHAKLDAEYAKKLDDLTALIKQQHQSLGEIKSVVLPTYLDQEAVSQSVFGSLASKTVFVNVANGHSLVTGLDLNDLEIVVSK